MQITNTISGQVDISTGVITISDVQELRDSSGDPQFTKHFTNVLDTKEGLVRDALIALGWTPPSILLHSRRENSDG